MTHNFNFALFRKPDEYEETLLRDRKALIKYWEDAAEAELIRDVIALANSARMLGKEAYLILGVRDAVLGSLDDICGIGDMFDRQISKGKTIIQARETVRQEMARKIWKHIFPLLSPEILFDTCEGKEVGYILIPPLSDEPFRVKQDFRSGGRTYLRKDQIWLRFGESKQEIHLQEVIDPNEEKLRYSHVDVPYVLPNVWHEYYKKNIGELDKRWVYFPKPEEKSYQDLKIDSGQFLNDVFEEYLRSDDKLLFIQGAAGCGKTLFLEKKSYLLSEQGLNDIEIAIKNEEFRPPDVYIPVFFQLRDLDKRSFMDLERFAFRLCGKLAVLWTSKDRREKPRNPSKLFENPRLKWLVILDGLDEIGNYDDRKAFIQIMHGFLSDYPLVKMVVSARPVMNLNKEFLEGKVIKISPLDSVQVERYLLSFRDDKNEEEINSFVVSCQQNSDLWKLLTTPVYLRAAAGYLNIPTIETDSIKKDEDEKLISSMQNLPMKEGQVSDEKTFTPYFDASLSFELEKPISNEQVANNLIDVGVDEYYFSAPRLLDRIYTSFWKREEERKLISDVQRYCANTYFLAVKMRQKPGKIEWNNAKTQLGGISGLKWVLEMGVLSDDDTNHVFFMLPSSQVYAAAKCLQWREGGNTMKYMRKKISEWSNEYLNEVEGFFFEITGKPLKAILQTQGDAND